MRTSRPRRACRATDHRELAVNLTVLKRSYLWLFVALVACTPSTPAAEPDAGAPGDDAPALVDEDAPSVVEEDAGGCPVPAAGRWAIGTLTNSGPACEADDSIDLEFHPVAFTVGSDGTITSCECDRPTDACTPGLAGTLGPEHCENLLQCASGGSLWVYVTSATTAEIRMHSLVSSTGCYASGPFNHE